MTTEKQDIGLTDLLDCPTCPNQGWYAQGNIYDGTAEQVQCEFCWTHEKSKFFNEFLKGNSH